ncbi:hypothetical protein GCM10010207_60170 [Streptomyces atratus]|nr:hypothetical protein GCM10010207_60170 [Streptomyces atratus]
MNDHIAGRHACRGLNRRGFLAAAGLTVAGAAIATTAQGRAGAVGAADAFRIPAEDVRHTRTWMAWPDRTAIWGSGLGGVQADIALIARTIAKYEPVVMCANSAGAAKARSMCGSAVTILSSVPVDDCWMRDTGPVFRTDGSGGLDAVGLGFNGWGNKQTHAKDALVAERIASYVGVPFTYAGLVGEGGAIEQDGNGTLMATRSSLVNRNRNPGMSESELGRRCATRTAPRRSSGSTVSAARTSPTTTSTPRPASWPPARRSSRCPSRRTTTRTRMTRAGSTRSCPRPRRPPAVR